MIVYSASGLNIANYGTLNVNSNSVVTASTLTQYTGGKISMASGSRLTTNVTLNGGSIEGYGTLSSVVQNAGTIAPG